jgi:hypothetical protein
MSLKIVVLLCVTSVGIFSCGIQKCSYPVTIIIDTLHVDNGILVQSSDSLNRTIYRDYLTSCKKLEYSTRSTEDNIIIEEGFWLRKKRRKPVKVGKWNYYFANGKPREMICYDRNKRVDCNSIDTIKYIKIGIKAK